MADIRGPSNAAQRSTPGGAFADRAWMAWVTRCLHNIYVGSSKGMAGPEGVRIDGAGAIIIGKITSGIGGIHVCDMYANGVSAAATDTGRTVRTPYVAGGESLPIGTVIATTTINGLLTALPGGVWV